MSANGDALPNGEPRSRKSGKTSRETLFTSFLYQYIDEIEENLAKVDLNTPLNQEKLIEVLNASSCELFANFIPNYLANCLLSTLQCPV